MRAYYFGCWGQPGHGFYLPGMRSGTSRSFEEIPWGRDVDTGLAPTIGPRRRYSQNEAPQGHAALHHKDGWTALSFWDRSGDSRGNSNSTFLFHATLTFDEALVAARERFPQLLERFPFEIVESPYVIGQAA